MKESAFNQPPDWKIIEEMLEKMMIHNLVTGFATNAVFWIAKTCETNGDYIVH